MFFFFKQKTAYEMRISDWSSDVCSSDLSGLVDHADRRLSQRNVQSGKVLHGCSFQMLVAVHHRPRSDIPIGAATPSMTVGPQSPHLSPGDRSEERRVGKECVSTCRSRWSPDH